MDANIAGVQWLEVCDTAATVAIVMEAGVEDSVDSSRQMLRLAGEEVVVEKQLGRKGSSWSR